MEMKWILLDQTSYICRFGHYFNYSPM